MFLTEIIQESKKLLKDAGLDNPSLDAELLVSHALGVDRHRLIIDHDKKIGDEEIVRIKKIISRRIKFEPVAYILGRKEFYSLDFIVNRSVLIPRPETELLVDLAIYYAKQDSMLLDLGTGSGAISISVKYNRNDLDVYASDISMEAIRVAKRNSNRILGKNRIKFFSGDIFSPFDNMKFQVIVSNPPYVDRDKIHELQRDLTYEPEIALFSDNNGRADAERIIAQSRDFLSGDGILIMEIGCEMKKFVEKIGRSNGFNVSVLNDYSGLPRVAVFKN